MAMVIIEFELFSPHYLCKRVRVEKPSEGSKQSTRRYSRGWLWWAGRFLYSKSEGWLTHTCDLHAKYRSDLKTNLWFQINMLAVHPTVKAEKESGRLSSLFLVVAAAKANALFTFNYDNYSRLFFVHIAAIFCFQRCRKTENFPWVFSLSFKFFPWVLSIFIDFWGEIFGIF